MKEDKNRGLYQKYCVEKINNPDKKINAIVLEFDDPVAQIGIWKWAKAIKDAGFHNVYLDVVDKLYDQGFFQSLKMFSEIDVEKDEEKEKVTLFRYTYRYRGRFKQTQWTDYTFDELFVRYHNALLRTEEKTLFLDVEK